MGQIIHPNNYEYRGVWLLDKPDFIELEKELSIIKDGLETTFDLEVTDYVRAQNPEISAEDLIQRVKEAKLDFPFARKIYIAFFKSTDNTKLEGNNLSDILRDKNLNSFSPEEFYLTIYYSENNRFTIQINKINDRLEYELVCSHQPNGNDLRDHIEQWIEKRKPTTYVNLWVNYGDVFAFIFLILTIIFGLAVFNDNELDSNVLNYAKAHSLIKHGIDSTNISQAIETILRIESNYREPGYKPIIQESDPIYTKLFVIALIILVFSAIRPTTMFGLGKKRPFFKFYKFWVRLVTFTVPSMLIITPFMKKIAEWFAN